MSGTRVIAVTDSNAELEQALSAIAADPSRRVYPLMDGAAFQNLPADLAKAGIAHRSLFLNIKDKELIRAGPWLIDPYHEPDRDLDAWGGIGTAGDGEKTLVPQSLSELLTTHGADSDFHAGGGPADPAKQMKRILGLAREAPCAVFWIGGETLREAAMWRHLRSLNNVLIPREFVASDLRADAPTTRVEASVAYEAVTFRHGDGNVMAEVLPVLDSTQFSRLFGPANAMIFLAPDHPGSKGSPLRRAMLPENSPPGAPGLLKLSDTQMRGIGEARLARSSRRVATYLRKVAPEQTEGLDDAALLQQTAGFVSEAHKQGITSETAIGKYCYLQSVTGGRAGSQSGVREYFAAKNGVSMDDKVALLLKSVILAARERENA